jgi:hypothetical protein
MVAMQREERDIGFVLQGLRHAIDKLELEFARFAAEFAQGPSGTAKASTVPATGCASTAT